MSLEIGYSAAFLAGLISFASPCVLPLVPAYLSFLAGLTFDEVASDHRSRSASLRVVIAALAFVAGFITIFVALGASATYLGALLADNASVIAKISGVLIAVLGFYYMGLIKIPLLQRDARFHPVLRRAGPFGAYIVGLAFAFGWTPCVGPVLAAILAIAGSTGDVWHGSTLLLFYGLGIGSPFILAAFAFQPFLRVTKFVREKLRWIEVASGSLLVATGVLIFLGSLANVSAWLLHAFPFLGKIG